MKKCKILLAGLVLLFLIAPAQTVAQQPPAATPAATAPAATPAPVATVPAATAPVVTVTQPVVTTTPAAAATPAAAPVPVVVAPTYEQAWWQLLLKHLIELLFFIITGMAVVFIRVLSKKFHFEDQSAKINDVLARASGYAEQKSLNAAKLDGKPTPGAEKLKLATTFATSLAKEYKLADKGADWWEDKLESWLGVGKDKLPTPAPAATPVAPA